MKSFFKTLVYLLINLIVVIFSSVTVIERMPDNDMAKSLGALGVILVWLFFYFFFAAIFRVRLPSRTYTLNLSLKEDKPLLKFMSYVALAGVICILVGIFIS